MTPTMIGESVGPYRITRKIGEGGMGTVYAAQHALLGHQAAVKVLRKEYSSDEPLLQRFFNEARAAALAKHPGIIAVFDFGHAANGSAYIVMEYLEGEPLSRRLRRGRILEPDAARLARQVASALEVAHSRHVVHRDLKPDNVFLVPDPEVVGGERAKVLDFGIAKLAGDQGPSAVMTSTGQVMGTPTYMAPEQARGAANIDHRADVYALGVLLYEMVTGRPPFVGEGAGDVIAKHIYIAPLDPRGQVPELSAALTAVILRCLEKDPGARYQSMAALSAALEAAGASDATPAPLIPPMHALTSGVGTTMSSAAAAVDLGRARVRGRRRLLIVLLALAAVLTGTAIGLAVTKRHGAATSAAGGPRDAGSAAAPVLVDAVVVAPPAVDAAAAVDALGVPPLAPDAAGPATVEVQIASVPPGATILDPTGKRLGVTDATLTLPRHEGTVALVLHKSGYADLAIAVSTEASSKASFPLVRRSGAQKPPDDPMNPYNH